MLWKEPECLDWTPRHKGAVGVIWNIWSVLSPFFAPPMFSLPSHHVSAFPSADCLKGRGGHFIHKCRDSNGTPLYMPRLWRLAPDFTSPTPTLPPPPYFTLQIPEAPQRLCAERRHKNKMKKKKKDLLFYFTFDFVQRSKCMFQSPLPPSFSVHCSAIALDRGGRAAEDWRKTLRWPNCLILFNLKVFYIKWYCDFLKKMTRLSVVIFFFFSLLHSVCPPQ